MKLQYRMRLGIVVEALLIGILVSLVACTIKKPARETPAPKSETLSKSFFLDEKGKPKTFMIGLAPESESGYFSEHSQAGYANNVNLADHLNVVFEITESKLIGKEINPSLPDQPEKWKPVLTIGIKRHFYRELAKDDYGRDTQKEVENDSRSHWSARPEFELDLASTAFEGNSLSYAIGKTLSVDEIEIDLKNNFIGFSLDTTDPVLANERSKKLRFNMLAYKHNPNFKKTPFNFRNYQFFNVVHYTGKRSSDLSEEILYAGHWDLAEDRVIYLNNVPEKYVDLAKQVIESWNNELKKIGAIPEGKKGFVPTVKEMKHPFDFRYPNLHWISDRRVSSYSPLGVGQAQMDTLNGEILWGSVTIYGGFLEAHIQRETTSSQSLGILEKEKLKTIFDMVAPKERPQVSFSPSQHLGPMAGSLEQGLEQQKQIKALVTGLASQNKLRSHPQEVPSKIDPQLRVHFLRGIDQQYQRIQNEVQRFTQGSNIGSPFKTLFERGQDHLVGDLQKKTPEVSKKPNRDKSKSHVCLERTFAEVGDTYSQSAQKNPGSLEGILVSVFKDLMTHEFGHMLGLGHNFKENILPAPNSVPEKYFLELQEAHKSHLTNFSSVMGYKHAQTEILTPAEKVKPGPHDVLLLRYLYKQEYSVFKPGDEDFSFLPIPADGLLPVSPGSSLKPQEKTAGNSQGTLKTTYFPQCNDWDASLTKDAFCNRFDRGSSAEEIVENYFINLKGDLARTLTATTDARGGDVDYREYSLWKRSFDTLSRVRLFYDEMRRIHAEDINKFRLNEQAVLEFSRCSESQAFFEPTLRSLFENNPSLLGYCKANALAIKNYQELLEKDVLDFSDVDYSKSIIPGTSAAGDVNDQYKFFLGTWKELGAFPLKYMSLYALLSPQPFANFEHRIHQDRNFGFSYSSLYPFEYTEALAGSIVKNIQFAIPEQNIEPRIGQTVASFSHLFDMNYWSNDGGRFPNRLTERVRNQNSFNFDIVAVIVEASRDTKNPTLITQWQARVYDSVSNKEIPARSVHILPEGKIIALADGMFLHPITNLQMYSEKEGYVFAYRASYNIDNRDRLAESGLRFKLTEKQNEGIESCVGGTNGLKKYFVPGENFKGFVMASSQKPSTEDHNNFLNDVDRQFANYYSSALFKDKPPKPETCQEALRSMALILSTAALANGIWLPEALSLMLK